MYEKELQRILNASQNNALTFSSVQAYRHSPSTNLKALIHAISDKLGRTRKDEYSSDENLQIPQMFYYSLGKTRKNTIGLSKNSCTLLPCCPIPSIGKC